MSRHHKGRKRTVETSEVLAQELGEGREDAWKAAQAIYEVAARTEERLTEGPWMEADELGELSWTPHVVLIATVRKQMEEMRAVRMSALPIHRLVQVMQHCEGLKATAEAIRAFSAREDPAANLQVALVMSLREQYENLLEEVGPWMAFARCAGNPARTAGEDVRGLAAQASELVADMQGLKGKAEEELARSVQRAQEVELEAMDAIRDVAERSGAAAFADGFEAEGRRNGVKAIAWLSGAGLALLVEVNWLLFGLRGPPMSTPLQNDDLHRWFVFAAVAGMLFYIALICVRQFQVWQNQAIRNGHRATALRTLKAFNVAAQSQEAKDAVLKAVADCAFGQTDTGLTRGGGTAPPSPTQVVQLAREAKGD